MKIFCYYLLTIMIGFCGLTDIIEATETEGNSTNSDSDSSVINNLNNVSKDNFTKIRLTHCPLIGELDKNSDNNTWRAGQLWVSHNASVANKIASFLGAQWIGVKIGQVLCVYKTDNEVEFPISLNQHINKPIVEPKSGKWSPSINGSRLCKSVNVYDCNFQEILKMAHDDIYKELEYTHQQPGINVEEDSY